MQKTYNTTVETLDLKSLRETPGNPQIMELATFAGLVDAFKKRGWYLEKPTVWKREDGVYQIISGHHRIQAAIKAKITHTDCTVIDDESYTEVQAKQDVIEANQRKGEIDEEKLKAFVGSLMEEHELDTSFAEGVGMNQAELHEILEKDFGEEERKDLKPFSKARNLEEEGVSDEENEMGMAEWINSFKEILVMFSGGKDSQATVAWCIDNGVDPSKMTLVWNRTPFDYPDLEEFNENFSKETGIPLEKVGKKNDIESVCEIMRRNGFPLPYSTWCTGTWKIQPLESWVIERGLKGSRDVIFVQGWRAEESDRRANSKQRAIYGRYNIPIARPILDMTKEGVFEIIKKHNWKLHYSYKYRDRLGCIYCFTTDRQEWMDFRENDPEVFFRALRFVAEGAMSKNISGEDFKNAVRKMMGLDTIRKTFKAQNIAAPSYIDEPDKMSVVFRGPRKKRPIE